MNPESTWSRLWHCRKTRPLVDLAVGVVVFAVLVWLAIRYGLAEHWHRLHEIYEDVAVDGIPVAFAIAMAVCAWFAWRRWRDFRHEAADGEAARQRQQEESVLRARMERSLQEAQYRAAAADRAKSDFLASMSHELRTPLNAIIGFAEMMEHEVRGPLGDPRYKEYVASIKDSGAHLLQFVNEILSLAKIEAGKLELHEEVFDLAETAGAAVRLVAPQARHLGVALHKRWPPQPVALRGDPHAVRQVLTSLLSNACKFSKRGGIVVLQTAMDADGGCVITVRDWGIGMTPEEVELVLKPFGRVDGYVSHEQAGAGLGLPLAKALTELHGGRLVVESTPGLGTEVSIILPPERVVKDPGGIILHRAAS